MAKSKAVYWVARAKVEEVPPHARIEVHFVSVLTRARPSPYAQDAGNHEAVIEIFEEAERHVEDKEEAKVLVASMQDYIARMHDGDSNETFESAMDQ